MLLFKVIFRLNFTETQGFVITLDPYIANTCTTRPTCVHNITSFHWHLLTSAPRLVAAWKSIRNDKPWQITFSGNDVLFRESSWLTLGDRHWNSGAAALQRILNGMSWNIEGGGRGGGRPSLIVRPSPRLLCIALMCHTNNSTVRLWQRLSNPIRGTSKQIKLQISQRRSATPKE